MKTYSLLDLFKLIISKWWICFVAALFFAIAGFGIAKITESKTFQASTTLTISHNYSKLDQSDEKENTSSAYDLTQSDILLQNSIANLIKNSSIMENAKKKVHFSSRDINVNSPDNTVLININVHTTNSHKSVKVANILAKSTKKILPRILPAAGKVIVAKKASQTVKYVVPSSKKYSFVGAIFGLVLSGVILLWNDIKDRLK